MTVICSWCREEGRTGFVGEKVPFDDRRETHGICLEHQIAIRIEKSGLFRIGKEGGSLNGQ